MANPEHLKILKQGVEVWNKWREENPEVKPDLSESIFPPTDFSGINLNGANLESSNFSNSLFKLSQLNEVDFREATCKTVDFRGSQMCEIDAYEAEFSESNFRETNLWKAELDCANLEMAIFQNANLSEASLVLAKANIANFKWANLCMADLREANLRVANLNNAILREVDLFEADLYRAYCMNTDFTNADLRRTNFKEAKLIGAILNQSNISDSNLFGANLQDAKIIDSSLNNCNLIKINLLNAVLSKCNIYGISAWDIKKDGLIQKDLIITPPGEPEITVDDLEVAQFIYLMLNNQKIRDVIETLTSKAVLILGRFTEERKAVLDALKDELRRRNYLPIVFDFQNAAGKDLDETVNLLARMSRFVIADVTDAKSIPQELKGFVEGNPSIPVLPLILKAQVEYAMFEHFRRYPWVLPLYEYESPKVLLENLIPAIITPAEQKVEELRRK